MGAEPEVDEDWFGLSCLLGRWSTWGSEGEGDAPGSIEGGE